MKKILFLFITLGVSTLLGACGPSQKEIDKQIDDKVNERMQQIENEQQQEKLRQEAQQRQQQELEQQRQQEEADRAQAQREVCLAFLKSMYNNVMGTLMNESWVKKHTTASCKRQLKNDYDYDGEGYATWMIGGWGDDIEMKFVDVKPDGNGNYYLATLKAEPSDYYNITGRRVIRLEVYLENGAPVINSYKWVSDIQFN